MKSSGFKVTEAFVNARRKKAEAFADILFNKMTEQRERIPGQPSPQEIAQRLIGVVEQIRRYVEMFGALSQDEHRWLLAIFLTREFWPERIPALDAALEPCRDIVDEALVSVDVTNRKIDMGLLREVAVKAEEIAARRQFQKLQADARERLARKAEGVKSCCV